MGREELREIVIAIAERNYQEDTANMQRVFQLAGFPYDFEEEKRRRALLPLMVEPWVSFLLGKIDEDGLITAIVTAAFEVLKEKEEPLEVEEEEMLKGYLEKLLREIVRRIIPAGSWVKAAQYVTHAIELADKRGIPPKEVFRSDALHNELLRSLYNVDEVRVMVKEKVSDILETDTLVTVYLKPMIESMTLSEEETSKIIKEMKEEMESDQKFRQRLKRARTAALLVCEEKIGEIYGMTKEQEERCDILKKELEKLKAAEEETGESSFT